MIFTKLSLNSALSTLLTQRVDRGTYIVVFGKGSVMWSTSSGLEHEVSG